MLGWVDASIRLELHFRRAGGQPRCDHPSVVGFDHAHFVAGQEVRREVLGEFADCVLGKHRRHAGGDIALAVQDGCDLVGDLGVAGRLVGGEGDVVERFGHGGDIARLAADARGSGLCTTVPPLQSQDQAPRSL